MRRLICRVLGHKAAVRSGYEFLPRPWGGFGPAEIHRERYCARCGASDAARPFLKPALDRAMRENWR